MTLLAVFFQKMNEQEKGQSFFISPLSAQFNLGMLANGAAGKTLEEIASVLSVSKNKPSLANNYFFKTDKQSASIGFYDCLSVSQFHLDS